MCSTFKARLDSNTTEFALVLLPHQERCKDVMRLIGTAKRAIAGKLQQTIGAQRMQLASEYAVVPVSKEYDAGTRVERCWHWSLTINSDTDAQ